MTLAKYLKIGDKIFCGLSTEKIMKIRRTTGRLKNVNDDQFLYFVYLTSGYKVVLYEFEGLTVNK